MNTTPTPKETAASIAAQHNLTITGNPHGFWGSARTQRGIRVCAEDSLFRFTETELLAAIAKAEDLAAAEAVVSALATLPAQVEWSRSHTWGPGPREIVKVSQGEWTLERQLSGLPADCGLRGPRPKNMGWDDVKIEVLVRQHLDAVLDKAISAMERPEKPTLELVRGDALDRSMGWDSWPAGSEHVANVTEATLAE